MGPDAVKDLATGFVLVEPEVEERAQEPSRLGTANRDRTLDAGRGAILLQMLDEIANRCGPEPDHRGVLRLIDQLVDFPGLEAGGHEDIDPLLVKLPLPARNDGAWTVAAIAHRELQCRVVRICDR
jgi:hypothetical protein